MEAGGNHNYAEAVRLIDRMAAIRARQGEDAEHAAYLVGLKLRYKAKRNFMKLFA